VLNIKWIIRIGEEQIKIVVKAGAEQQRTRNGQGGDLGSAYLRLTAFPWNRGIRGGYRLYNNEEVVYV